MTDKSQHSDKQPADEQPPKNPAATSDAAQPAAGEDTAKSAAEAGNAGTNKADRPADAKKANNGAAKKGKRATAKTDPARAKATTGTEAAAPANPPKRSGGWFTLLLILILIGAVAALGYYGWQQQQQVQARIAQLNEDLQGQDQQISSLSGSMEQVRAEVQRALQESAQASQRQSQQLREQVQQELQQQNRQIEQQLGGLRDRVRAISTTTTDDWKLAEAYYLTRLAGQRLLMERDTGSALALLQTADQIVRNYPDPDLYPVRGALAEDIASLKLANNVDRAGLYLQIAALSGKLDQLQVSEPLNFEPEPAQASPPAAQPEAEDVQGIWQSIRQSFQRALAKFSDFIRISHDNGSIRPLMAPEEKLYLRSSLQTALDTAQLALMREQPEIYRDSLEKAGRLLQALYVQSEARGRVLAELQSLHDTDITQSLPDISESQETLGDYLDQRHRLAPQGSRQAAPEGQAEGAQP